ncbi:uncharacterized protein LOC111627604 isoform X2 [Centruroides sculpturatus]|uniref:uncharacterized protein LOC111627604 isoform X2 n=1 Tax=Centruroides sculpturatus TaxID=218467 RepID=UPI000C6E5C0F|nr:uncharacterized protein LOC111627604 isoform X2 [Centruroides sculpturatus]
MKEMFLIIFTCVMFMMVLGGHPNDTLFTHYCEILNKNHRSYYHIIYRRRPKSCPAYTQTSIQKNLRYLDVDKFSSCLQKTFSNQVKTAFYDCVHAIAVNIRYPKEIQYFFCNQATKQQIKDFEECLHMKLTYRQMDIYNNKFAKCLEIPY